MAEVAHSYKKNAPGYYFVDEGCVYCDLCRATAPSIFAECKEDGIAYVHSQPSTEFDFKLAQEALEGCPTDSIGIQESGESIKLDQKTITYSEDLSNKIKT